MLEQLSGQPEKEPETGYAAFSPEIARFLKEHLFADILERDVLAYQERELTAIAALMSLGGVESMLQGQKAAEAARPMPSCSSSRVWRKRP
ncbi:hypothetical protein [Hymenobacter convexus]|uniref:hypothetical protein n=1 Tax=Hymenobacter sp. CA1UV-4 TaxID=3063782 RepID=UPI00271300B9|nr:hypothetical protein [Hymenobacter sp. CA1UV-4]MDO7853531.1 hypothetical protein [Hymenobacter sp. CA1UV-4]